jgi:ferredoxin-NADP reductase
MIKLLDDLLDRITMYRLAFYYLAGLLVVAFALGLTDSLTLTRLDLAFSTVLVLAVCWLTNFVFVRVFAVPESRDSVWITALILVLIMSPAHWTDWDGIGALAFASVWAMASKYIVAIGRRHVFNPAAFAAAMSGLLLDHPPTWWIAGNLAMLPFILVGGLLTVRKLQRGDLVTSCVVATAIAILLTSTPGDDWTALVNTVVYSPLLFVAFVMLTEPTTTPPGRRERILYGALVGVLLVPTLHIGSLYFTPEAAILIGNVFAWAVSPKRRFALTLQKVERSAATACDYVFGSDRPLAFAPGQYLEFALGLPRGDSRGNRRYFTIASAPTEGAIRLGVKFNPDASAFKQALAAMKPGDTIFASGLAGDFVLPADRDARLAFLAGGIGITPFRSMLRYLVDRGESRPIVMLYAADRPDDLAYRDLVERARRELGVRTAYAVLRDGGALPGAHVGFIDEAMLRREIPDYAERTFYVSGPRAMVVACERLLHRLGVPASRIKTDFFPGFA